MDSIISDVKRLIDHGDLECLKEYYAELIQQEEETEPLDFPYLFRHIYVHACLKKKTDMVAWLKELYETMDPITKIALRQIFPYGEHLLRR
jgi:hypothetical protein